jgi:hypothetical protein
MLALPRSRPLLMLGLPGWPSPVAAHLGGRVYLDSLSQRRRADDWLIPVDGRKISRTGDKLEGSRRELTFGCSPWYAGVRHSEAA